MAVIGSDDADKSGPYVLLLDYSAMFGAGDGGRTDGPVRLVLGEVLASPKSAVSLRRLRHRRRRSGKNQNGR